MGNIIIWVFDFIFQIFSKITSFILKPIIDWAVNYNLLSYDYFGSVQTFLNDYFYKYIRFAKEVIINVTGIPANLFILLGTLLGIVLLFYMSTLAIRAILNAYGIVRTGRSIGKDFNK